MVSIVSFATPVVMLLLVLLVLLFDILIITVSIDQDVTTAVTCEQA